jgi:hypothetical protein
MLFVNTQLLNRSNKVSLIILDRSIVEVIDFKYYPLIYVVGGKNLGSYQPFSL